MIVVEATTATGVLDGKNRVGEINHSAELADFENNQSAEIRLNHVWVQ